MKKAVEPNSQPPQKSAAETGRSLRQTFADGREQGGLAQLASMMNQSPRVQTQLKLAEEMNQSPSSTFQQPAQMKGKLEEKKPTQMKGKMEEKKAMQGKFDHPIQEKRLDEKKPAQTKGKLEEKKPAQMKGKLEQKKKPMQGRFETPVQEKRLEEKKPAQTKLNEKKKPVQGRFEDPAGTAQLEEVPAANRTGLPDQIRSGIESLSGISLDDVKVHYNSDKPKQLNALAYAQGTDIHVGPGQEKHLPHEAWHIVQQKQGRVQPTMQMKAGVPVNDDPGLEKEADVMGSASLQSGKQIRTQGSNLEESRDLIRPVQRITGCTVIQGYWDVAVKPIKNNDVWYIGSVVIQNRPPKPDTSGMEEEGGKSFHHESAWNLVEKQVTQFQGQTIEFAVNYLCKYGLTGSGYGPMKHPGSGQLEQLEAINNYFHAFLSTKADEAGGWLGPTGKSHSSQGGRVTASLKALKKSGFTKENIHKALDASFEPGPSVEGEDLFAAAQNHADMFYAAFQFFLEENPNVSIPEHEEVVEILKDWDTKYWQEPTDELMNF